MLDSTLQVVVVPPGPGGAGAAPSWRVSNPRTQIRAMASVRGIQNIQSLNNKRAHVREWEMRALVFDKSFACTAGGNPPVRAPNRQPRTVRMSLVHSRLQGGWQPEAPRPRRERYRADARPDLDEIACEIDSWSSDEPAAARHRLPAGRVQSWNKKLRRKPVTVGIGLTLRAFLGIMPAPRASGTEN